MTCAFLQVGLLVAQVNFGLAYGTPRLDRPGDHSCLEGHRDGYFMVGHAIDESGDTVGLLLCVNRLGDILMEKTIKYSNSVSLNSTIRTSDGDYVIVGHTFTSGTDAIALRVSESGDIVWARVLEQSAGWDDAYSVIETSDHGFLIVGAFQSQPYAIKLDADGELEWAKSYRAPNSSNSYLHSAVEYPGGGFVLAGFTDYYGAGAYDLLLIKIGESGTAEWAKGYGTNRIDMATRILPAVDQGFMVAGSSWPSEADEDFLLLKIDLNGVIQWSRIYGKQGGLERPFALARTSDNGYIVGGYTRMPGTGGVIAKFNGSGVLLWDAVFDGSDIDWFRSVTEDSDSSIIAFGGTRSYGSGNYDLLLIRMPQNGSYPGCLTPPSYQARSYDLITTTVPLTETSPATVAKDMTPVTRIPGLTKTSVCPGGETAENPSPSSPIRCILCPDGLLFESEEPLPVLIYEPDGRLVISENLKRGQTRITLDSGVYFWMAGPHRGRAVVR